MDLLWRHFSFIMLSNKELYKFGWPKWVTLLNPVNNKRCSIFWKWRSQTYCKRTKFHPIIHLFSNRQYNIVIYASIIVRISYFDWNWVMKTLVLNIIWFLSFASTCRMRSKIHSNCFYGPWLSKNSRSMQFYHFVRLYSFFILYSKSVLLSCKRKNGIG